MYFIDVQGTIISDADKSPINGAMETLNYLDIQHIPFAVVTNNTKKSSSDFLDFLQNMGFCVDMKRYLDPLMLLAQKLPEKNIAPYGDSAFIATLEQLGFTIDFKNPTAVLIGVKKDYTGAIFAQIIDFLLKGAKLIGMHETTLYASEGLRYPGSGAILKMLQAATLVPYEVVGKPSVAFYAAAKKLLEIQTGTLVDYASITMISDDVKGDLVGAKALGMKTVFVLSGKYRHEDEIIPYLSQEERPHHVCTDMQMVLEMIQGGLL